jgi:hypothetical protein
VDKQVKQGVTAGMPRETVGRSLEDFKVDGGEVVGSTTLWQEEIGVL